MSWITDEAKVAWAKVKSAFSSTEVQVETALTATEQKYLPAFTTWAHTLESTLEGQGLTILEQGLTDIGEVVLTGGNPGSAIAALVPQVVAQVKTDLNQDKATVEAAARNAAYTAIGLAIAALPTSAQTADAPAPAAA